MFGLDINLLEWFPWIIAIIITLYVSIVKNPHNEGTNEHQTLRLCRIGLALLVWSFVVGSGLIGITLVSITFILAVVAIIKGRILYGVLLILVSVFAHALSVAYPLLELLR
jgi:hypothetical protein